MELPAAGAFSCTDSATGTVLQDSRATSLFRRSRTQQNSAANGRFRRAPASDRGVILYLHGGAWVPGWNSLHRRMVGGTSRKPRQTAPWRSTIAWLRSTPIPPLWKIAWLPIGGCSAMERDPAKIRDRRRFRGWKPDAR